MEKRKIPRSIKVKLSSNVGDFVFGKPQSYEFQLFKGFNSGDGAIKFYNAQSVVAVLI